MIRKIKSEEIPICVEVIKKSFLTVADGYGPLEGMILPPVVNLTFISYSFKVIGFLGLFLYFMGTIRFLCRFIQGSKT